MRPAKYPSSLEIPFLAMLELSQECWRLKRIARSLEKQSEGSACKYAVRRISALLDEAGIGIEDYAGRPYDPGLAPEVVQVVEDPRMAPGGCWIEETLSATVTWQGYVVQKGQIVVRQAAGTDAAEEKK